MKSFEDDIDFLRNRIAEIKKEREQQQQSEMSKDYPNTPMGGCYYCRENKTPCDGSCEFLGFIEY